MRGNFSRSSNLTVNAHHRAIQYWSPSEASGTGRNGVDFNCKYWDSSFHHLRIIGICQIRLDWVCVSIYKTNGFLAKVHTHAIHTFLSLIPVQRVELIHRTRPPCVSHWYCERGVIESVPVNIHIYAGRDCVSARDPSSRCLLAIHSRMKVLLIFVFFNNSGSSLSSATSLAEITSITKASSGGNPSSLRFLSTVRELRVRIDEGEGG